MTALNSIENDDSQSNINFNVATGMGDARPQPTLIKSPNTSHKSRRICTA